MNATMKNTEKRLRSLFDFQRFAGNPRLADLIRVAGLPGEAVELPDDELDLNAAGEADAWRKLPDDGEKP